MKEFKIAEPRTPDELAALLAESDEKTVLMAGGTDLLDELKSGVAAPNLVIDLRTVVGLAGISRDERGLKIGAMTTVARLAGDLIIEAEYAGLRQAALSLATPQLRNVGTLGGNLCQRPRCWYYRDPAVPCRKKGGTRCYAVSGRNKYHAIFGGGLCSIVFPSDLAPMLISLGARVTLAGAGGEKTIPLEDFYRLPAVDVRKETALEKGHYVKEVMIPAPRPGQKSAYLKLKERGTWDFALVSAAVTGIVDGKGLKDISIVMGGVAPIPWRLRRAEELLRGREAGEELLRRAAEESLKDAKPLGENGYKLALLTAVLKRSVFSLTDR